MADLMGEALPDFLVFSSTFSPPQDDALIEKVVTPRLLNLRKKMFKPPPVFYFSDRGPHPIKRQGRFFPSASKSNRPLGRLFPVVSSLRRCQIPSIPSSHHQVLCVFGFLNLGQPSLADSSALRTEFFSPGHVGPFPPSFSYPPPQRSSLFSAHLFLDF